MPRIDFYHLTKSSLDETLPELVSKAYHTGKKIKIKVGNEERVTFLNTLLWTFEEESFLPHATKKEGFSEMQPIFLSADDEIPNQACFLFVVDGAGVSTQHAQNFERLFYIFSASDTNELTKARQTWKMFDSNIFERHYWQQSETGKWQEKNL